MLAGFLTPEEQRALHLHLTGIGSAPLGRRYPCRLFAGSSIQDYFEELLPTLEIEVHHGCEQASPGVADHPVFASEADIVTGHDLSVRVSDLAKRDLGSALCQFLSQERIRGNHSVIIPCGRSVGASDRFREAAEKGHGKHSPNHRDRAPPSLHVGLRRSVAFIWVRAHRDLFTTFVCALRSRIYSGV